MIAKKIDQNNNSEILKFQLKQKALRTNRKSIKPKQSPIWLYPFASEIEYFKLIKRIVNSLILITTNKIKPMLSTWNMENKETIDHLDSPSDDIDKINQEFEQLKKEMFGENNESLKNILIPIITTMIIFNEKQNQKNIKRQLGTELILGEPWLQEMTKQWVSNNVSLITNLTNDYTKKINNAVIEAFQKNKSMSELTKTLTKINKEFATGKLTTIYQLKDGRRLVFKNEDLEKSKKKLKELNKLKNENKISNKEYLNRKNKLIVEKIDKLKKEEKIDFVTKGSTQSRSNLIARDQISTLNAQITKKRQQEVGISLYKWHTSDDERVRGRPGGKYASARPSHWALEGKICRWNLDSIYADTIEDAIANNWKNRSSINAVELHPGFDINCRCWGESIWDDVIEEVNNEIK